MSDSDPLDGPDFPSGMPVGGTRALLVRPAPHVVAAIRTAVQQIPTGEYGRPRPVHWQTLPANNAMAIAASDLTTMPPVSARSDAILDVLLGAVEVGWQLAAGLLGTPSDYFDNDSPDDTQSREIIRALLSRAKHYAVDDVLTPLVNAGVLGAAQQGVGSEIMTRLEGHGLEERTAHGIRNRAACVGIAVACAELEFFAAPPATPTEVLLGGGGEHHHIFDYGTPASVLPIQDHFEVGFACLRDGCDVQRPWPPAWSHNHEFKKATEPTLRVADHGPMWRCTEPGCNWYELA